MTILDGDIQLLKSERLTDFENGGGLPTGVAVVDGASNALFPDIAEMDRVFGNVVLRKAFPAVVTDNTDTYFAANIIIAQPPSDLKVSATLFTTSSWSDERADARDRLESYLAMGAEGRWMLYGNHLAGQRTLQLHCPNTVATPGVDDVLALVKRSDEAIYQYVRIARLIERLVNVEFEDTKGVFYRDVITVEISDSLRYAFPAGTMERFTADWFSPPTRIHVTVAADAASYYGVQPMKIAAALGDLTIKTQSIYTQLVPSALSETPITDARCAGDRSVIVPIAGADPITYESHVAGAAGASITRYFGSAIARGAVSIAGAGLVTVTDDSNGALVQSGLTVGSVDYSVGSVTWVLRAAVNVDATFTAAPAAAVELAGHTDRTAITTTNRGYTYVKTLWPAPAPGSISFSYRAQGKWYALYDNGAGGLAGDEGTGSGTINYATGAMVITTGALPDADTQLLYSWGSPTHFESHVGDTVFSLPAIKATILGGGLEAGSVTAKYTAGGVLRTVTDNGAGGLSGAGSGWIDYAAGTLLVRPSLLPDGATSLQIDFARGAALTELFTAGGAMTNISLAHPAAPGSISLAFSDAAGVDYQMTDDGAGNLVLRSTDASGGVASYGNGVDNSWGLGSSLVSSATSSVSVVDTSGIVGTVNYGAGTIALAAAIVLRYFKTQDAGSGLQLASWQYQTGTVHAAGTVTVKYRQASDSAGANETLVIDMPALQIDLLPTISNSPVAGSWRIKIGGAVYVDRAGTLVKNPSPATNSGVVAGSIDYSTGVATLTDYTGGGAPTISVAGLTRYGQWIDYRMMFRTSGAPLQVSSLYVSALRADTGAQISGLGAAGGDIDGALVDGTVDYTTGIVFVRFGEWVAKAGNEGQPWYDPDNVAGLQVWKPLYVLPDTAKYNAVVTSSLPLPADVLGLDPVRLPVDGRVPIYRKSNAVVIHHTAALAPQNVTTGQTINLGRERLAKVRLIGANGQTITAGYSQDLDAGTVTINSAAGYSQPITIEHRIEDAALVSDVQINGELTLTRPVTHDFPIGSYVSSVLYIGNMQARVSELFDQQTWQNAWADAVAGSPAAGTYNDTQYPLLVTNRGALDERWAIVFTNTTTVNVIGETVGQIVTGHGLAADLAPINPATGVPYFVLDAAGWGAGWAAGNVLRINTRAANYPVWIARTVLQGEGSANTDKFVIGIRGDVDAA